MKRWRVGTLSMGLLLIAVGVLILFAQFNARAVVATAVRWWPVVLILLGGEVLIYSFFSREEQPKVKYDIFSIFIIFTIICFGLGIYALSEVGLMDQLSRSVSAHSYELNLPYPEIILDDNIKKIVVEAPDASLVLRTTAGNRVLPSGSGRASADSQTAAAQLLGGDRVEKRIAGDTLYLSFNQVFPGSEMGYYARMEGFTLLVPGNRQLEINGGGTAKIYTDGFASDILTSGAGETILQLPADADCRVMASADEEGSFQGNVPWKITPLQASAEDGPGPVKGALTFGKGSHKINILDSGTVTVNKLD